MSGLETAVKAKSSAFGNYIDPQRALFDAPQLALVRVELPEYTHSGLGRALLAVIRYEFTDLGTFGVEGMSVGAASSRGIVVYEDMQPQVVASSHAELHARAPVLAEGLRKHGYPPELISVGVLHALDTESVFSEKLCHWIDVYHARASWIEAHPMEVRFASLEAMAGGEGINWDRALPNGPRFEV